MKRWLLLAALVGAVLASWVRHRRWVREFDNQEWQ